LQVRALPDPLGSVLRRERVSMALQDQMGKVRDALPRTIGFLSEVWAELKKVHWPTRKETYAATVVVLVITVLVAVFLGVVDFAISHVVQAVLS
jgi:preprotein translocase subunit SecE